MKNKKGITLIALIITIIVMLLLVGVSISIIFGEKGILEQAKTSGEDYKYEITKENIGSKTAYNREGNIDVDQTINNIKTLNLDEISTKDNGELDIDKFEKGLIVHLKNGDSVVIGDVKRRLMDDESDKSDETDKTDKTDKGEVVERRLIDVAKIGDYVDIGIEYEKNYCYSGESSQVKGWRVLSNNNTIKLVSAGTPISYKYDTWYSGGDERSTYKMLADLYKELSTEPENINYFVESGFKDENEQQEFNLKNVFDKSTYINIEERH